MECEGGEEGEGTYGHLVPDSDEELVETGRNNVSHDSSCNEGEEEQEMMSTSMASTSSSSERVNPFENFLLKNLKSATLSPSVFDSVDSIKTPSSNCSREFTGWDIRELAELFPKSLESSPSSHTNPFPTDSFIEAKAQADIYEYFNKGPIVPTPEGVGVQQLHLSFRTPVVEKRSTRKRKRGEGFTTDSWTNTELSLPYNLPPEVEAALQPFFNVECCSATEPCLAASDTDENDNIDNGKSIPLVLSNSNNSSLYRLSSSASQISVRRKLKLSFGDVVTPPKPSEGRSAIRYGDPFDNNHVISSPIHTGDHDTSDLTACFSRCEFTPAKNRSSRNDDCNSPDLTPIRT